MVAWDADSPSVIVLPAITLCRMFLIALAFASLLLAPPGPVAEPTGPFLIVLGIAQDGGYPQAGCNRACCAPAWNDPTLRRPVACLALIDPASGGRWLFDATPDVSEQLHQLSAIAPFSASQPAAASQPSSSPQPTSQPHRRILDGIFLTHAHIGHYAGLMQLGREVLGTRDIPVFAMPRMKSFLETNGPWDQLVKLNNIDLRPMTADAPIDLTSGLVVTPFLVPHRDEYSETVGYQIAGPHRRVLFIPDIDKWERWNRSLESALAKVDVAYLDATFYDENELPGRDMSEIPHPFIVETMQRLQSLPPAERAKVYFIHLNHTNPALQPHSPARKAIEEQGFHIAEMGERVVL